MWDCKSRKCVKVIDPAKDLMSKAFVSWISWVALDASESWLARSYGRDISLWNLPASECISKISTGASVQDMFFNSNQILAVGADPFLNRFDMNGAILSQTQRAPLSSFSIFLHPSGITAAGDLSKFWLQYLEEENHSVHTPMSSSSLATIPIHEVFISVQNDNPSKNITDMFDRSLTLQRVSTFKDDKRLREKQRGTNLGRDMKEAIAMLKISIVMLSKDYVYSSWCWEEFVVILQNRQKWGLIVLPIFYEMDPSDIRKQRGDAFKIVNAKRKEGRQKEKMKPRE